ncbi:MAG: lipid-A-disaccharide synthase [Candidatus Gygaella obscura]|nr:lipid-A-disaccharide synthase [Candidatus Gygaella obscura]
MYKNIVIVAGEPSGDSHAANLVRKLKNTNPELIFSGLGGYQMQKEGVKILHNLSELAVVGFFEVLKNYKKIKAIFEELLTHIEKKQPEAIILVDYPGFNLRLAKKIKEKNKNIKIVYYISPQIWAWNKNRISLIKQVVDKMVVFFKFEESLYKNEAVDVDFVGHPLLDWVNITKDKNEFIKRYDLDSDKKLIALLPGSRKNEIKKNLSVMLKSCLLFSKKNRSAQFVILKPAELNIGLFKEITSRLTLKILIIENDTYNGIGASDFCLVASGTATLETAILNKPMFIIYKVNFLTWLIAKMLIKIDYIGLVNVVAGQKIIPEYIQFDAQARRIAYDMNLVLNNPEKINYIKERLIQVKKILGENGATQRAASIINNFICS